MVKPAGLLSNRYKLEDMPDLTGKVAIVVGGSRGIGEAAVRALVQKGCHVHIVSATKEHAEEAVQHVESESSAAHLLTTHNVDLGNLSAVKSLFSTLSSSLERLDQLYLIAGIGVGPFGYTADGLGNHFGVNNVAQVLIIDLMYGKLCETARKVAGTQDEGSVRIVSESSEMHRTAPGDVKAESLDEFGKDSEEMSPVKLYGRSKLGNIYTIAHLASLTAPPSTTSPLPISVHPGAVATEQQHGATESYPILGPILEKVAPSVFMSQEQGCESALWAGTATVLNTSERRDEAWGRYFSEADGKVGTESSQAQNPEMATRFWELCVKAIKDKTGYEVKLGQGKSGI